MSVSNPPYSLCRVSRKFSYARILRHGLSEFPVSNKFQPNVHGRFRHCYIQAAPPRSPVKRAISCFSDLGSVLPDENPTSIAMPEFDSVYSIEAAAVSAIRQAELEYREAARKLMKAQARLKSARLAAKELSLTQTKEAQQFVENSSEKGLIDNAASFSGSLSVPLDYDEADGWHDTFSAVEAIAVAEERRKEGFRSFQRAAEVLRERLVPEPIQNSINDRHIELLDNGGQYHVAHWLISEVEDCLSEGSGGELVVNINLELAVQGCDPQLVQFLQCLPYDKVLGIRTSVKPKAVDFCDGSTWETSVFPDYDEAEFVQTWQPLECDSEPRKSLKWKLEQLQPPAIDVEFSDERDSSTGLQTMQRNGLVSTTVPPLLIPAPELKPLSPTIGKLIPASLSMKKIAVCAVSFSYVLMTMVKSCELATLIVDACILGFVAAFVVSAACAVGAMSPPLPKGLQSLINRKWPQKGHTFCSWESVSVSNKPWDKVVFWMAATSAVLSAATLSAICVKTIQIGASFALDKVSQLVPFATADQVAKFFLTSIGIFGGNAAISESLPYVASSLMWLLLLTSVIIASSSVSLIVVGCTSRVEKA